MAKSVQTLFNGFLKWKQNPTNPSEPCWGTAYTVYYMYDDSYSKPFSGDFEVTTQDLVLGLKGDETNGFSGFQSIYGKLTVLIDSQEAEDRIFQLAKRPPNGPVGGDPENPYYLIEIKEENPSYLSIYYASINTNEITTKYDCGDRVADITFSDTVAGRTNRIPDLTFTQWQNLKLGGTINKLLQLCLDYEMITEIKANPNPVVMGAPDDYWQWKPGGVSFSNIVNVIPDSFNGDSPAAILDDICRTFGMRMFQTGDFLGAWFELSPWDAWPINSGQSYNGEVYRLDNSVGKYVTVGGVNISNPTDELMETISQGRVWRTLEQKYDSTAGTSQDFRYWSLPSPNENWFKTSVYSGYMVKDQKLNLNLNITAEYRSQTSGENLLSIWAACMIAIYDPAQSPSPYRYYTINPDLTTQLIGGGTPPTLSSIGRSRAFYKAFPVGSDSTRFPWLETNQARVDSFNIQFKIDLEYMASLDPTFADFKGFVNIFYAPEQLRKNGTIYDTLSVSNTRFYPLEARIDTSISSEQTESELPLEYVPNTDVFTIEHDWNHPSYQSTIGYGADPFIGITNDGQNPVQSSTRGNLTMGGYLAAVFKAKGWTRAVEGPFFNITGSAKLGFVYNGQRYHAESFEKNYREGITSGFFINYTER